MRLKCDNKVALQIVAKLVVHEQKKYIEIDCHFIQEKIRSGPIHAIHVSTKQQFADVFIKQMSQD